MAADADRENYPAEIHSFAPNMQTIEFIKTTQCRHIAEFGVYRGATTLEFAKYLNHEGVLYLFDYADRLTEVQALLTEHGYHNARSFPNSYKLLDSYNWSLLPFLEGGLRVFDYAFIDGAHTWAIDALTTLLLDKLLLVGGYLDFDDYAWTLAGSPTLGPDVFPPTERFYTREQMEIPHVQLIVDLLIKRDARYQEILPNKIYQKVAP